MRKKWPNVKLGEVLRRVERFEPRDDLTEYPFAGTYSFARGIFVGERKLGSTFALPKIQRIHAGDFIYCKIMAWEGAFGIAPKETDNCVMSGAFVVYELNRERINEKFLDYFFKVPDHWQSIGSQSTGTNVRRQSLHPNQFERAEIPLPPLTEQKRIVARIEELAAQINEARSLRKQAEEEAEALVHSNRTHAFKELAARFSRARIDSVANCRLGKMLDPRFKTGVGSTPYLRNANVQWDRLDLDGVYQMDFTDDERQEFTLESGDILVCEGGDIGKAAIWNNELPGCCYQKHFIVFAVTRRR